MEVRKGCAQGGAVRVPCIFAGLPTNTCGCDEYRNGASASDAVTCKKNQQEQGRWKCMPPNSGDGLCPGDHTQCVQFPAGACAAFHRNGPLCLAGD